MGRRKFEGRMPSLRILVDQIVIEGRLHSVGVYCSASHSERNRSIFRRFRPALQTDVLPLRYRHVKIAQG